MKNGARSELQSAGTPTYNGARRIDRLGPVRRKGMTRKKSIFISVACVVIALPALMAAYVAQGQKAQDAPADKPQTPAQNQTLKVDVDLVQVTATVTDAQNRYVTGLEQEHFQVWEDKLEQKIEYFSAE